MTAAEAGIIGVAMLLTLVSIYLVAGDKPRIVPWLVGAAGVLLALAYRRRGPTRWPPAWDTPHDDDEGTGPTVDMVTDDAGVLIEAEAAEDIERIGAADGDALADLGNARRRDG